MKFKKEYYWPSLNIRLEAAGHMYGAYRWYHIRYCFDTYMSAVVYYSLRWSRVSNNKWKWDLFEGEVTEYAFNKFDLKKIDLSSDNELPEIIQSFVIFHADKF